MLRAMPGMQIKTNEELRMEAERLMEGASVRQKRAQENDLPAVLDGLLREKPEGWWEEASGLMQKEENQIAIALIDKLLCFQKLYELGEKEKREGQVPTLCRFSTLDEMQEVYQGTVFCLRRMELGMADDGYGNFLGLLEAWKFSAEYLTMILHSRAVYNVQNTIDRLNVVLTESGYTDLSRCLLRCMNSAAR